MSMTRLYSFSVFALFYVTITVSNHLGVIFSILSVRVSVFQDHACNQNLTKQDCIHCKLTYFGNNSNDQLYIITANNTVFFSMSFSVYDMNVIINPMPTQY